MIDGIVSDSAQQPQPNDSGKVCVVAEYSTSPGDSWDETRCNDIVTDKSGRFTTMFELAAKLLRVHDSWAELPAGCAHAVAWPAGLQTTYDDARGIDRATVQATYAFGSNKTCP